MKKGSRINLMIVLLMGSSCALQARAAFEGYQEKAAIIGSRNARDAETPSQPSTAMRGYYDKAAELGMTNPNRSWLDGYREKAEDGARKSWWQSFKEAYRERAEDMARVHRTAPAANENRAAVESPDEKLRKSKEELASRMSEQFLDCFNQRDVRGFTKADQLSDKLLMNDCRRIIDDTLRVATQSNLTLETLDVSIAFNLAKGKYRIRLERESNSGSRSDDSARAVVPRR